MNNLWKAIATIFFGFIGLSSLDALSQRLKSKDLKQLYEEDQADRKPGVVDWSVVGKNDRRRRQRVFELIAENALKSGDDFYHAAMILQHGDKPDHYLLSHILSGAAARLGTKPAIWLSAASLDRYLQMIGQPQVFATQYKNDHETGEWTMEPIDNDLIPDALRQVYNVPTKAESENRLKGFSQEAQKKKA